MILADILADSGSESDDYSNDMTGISSYDSIDEIPAAFQEVCK